jgi:hypothetical protein
MLIFGQGMSSNFPAARPFDPKRKPISWKEWQILYLGIELCPRTDEGDRNLFLPTKVPPD